MLQVVALYSPGGSYDSLFLSNYATINIIDTLARVPGVGEVFQFGPLDYSMRIWLSSDQLTALGLTPSDVINAIRAQNVQAAVGRIGAQPMTDALALRGIELGSAELTDCTCSSMIVAESRDWPV